MRAVMTGRRARWIGDELGILRKVKNEFTGRSWLADGIERKAGQSSPRKDRNQGSFGETGTRNYRTIFSGYHGQVNHASITLHPREESIPGTDSVTGWAGRRGGRALSLTQTVLFSTPLLPKLPCWF